MTIFESSTNQIYVSVEPKYDKERSVPERQLFVFSYQVLIRNDGDTPIQIFHRSWVITDAYLNREFVEGEGVVGEKPVILPGEAFTYTSYCQLKTNFGTMRGHYLAVNDRGKTVKIDIPEFILSHPFAVQ